MTATATVLYDIRNEPPPVSGEIRGGVAGVLIGVLLLVVVWKRPDRLIRVLPIAWIVGWAALTAMNVREIKRAHAGAVARLERGDVKVVEGAVTKVTPSDGRGPEIARIGETTVAISYDVKVPGLHLTSLTGGPIREGKKLRVTRAGESILLVEQLE